MVPKKVLKRLLRLRELEEEQGRRELELAVLEENRVQQQMLFAGQRLAMGRHHFVEGIARGNGADRAGGVIEVEFSRRQQLLIKPRLEAVEQELARQREHFMTRRAERRQVETLVRDRDKVAAIETGRRAQQMLDDWYGRRTERAVKDREGSAGVGLVATAEATAGATTRAEESD